MTQQEIETLGRQWRRAKKMEQTANKMRRAIEDTLAANFEINEKEKRVSTESEKYIFDVTIDETITINADALQDAASVAGIDDCLSMFFRWKPELKKAEWKSASAAVKNALACAITIKRARPTFRIEKK